MPVYMIIDICVTDPECYARYTRAASAIVTSHGGRYLSRGGEITPVSGNWNPERIILLEFPDKNHLDRCFQSEEYRAIAPLREASTTSKAIIVEGRP